MRVIAKALRELDHRVWTQKRIGEELGVTRQAVSKWFMPKATGCDTHIDAKVKVPPKAKPEIHLGVLKKPPPPGGPPRRLRRNVQLKPPLAVRARLHPRTMQPPDDNRLPAGSTRTSEPREATVGRNVTRWDTVLGTRHGKSRCFHRVALVQISAGALVARPGGLQSGQIDANTRPPSSVCVKILGFSQPASK
jgi:hypothetical protein